MGFSLSNQDGVILFTLKDRVSLSEIQEILAIISKLLEKGNPFIFIVDTRESNGIPPVSAGLAIVKWMRNYKQHIIKTLEASSIVFKNQKVSALLNWVFTRQKPSAPNKITTDIEAAITFVKDHVNTKTKTK